MQGHRYQRNCLRLCRHDWFDRVVITPEALQHLHCLEYAKALESRPPSVFCFSGVAFMLQLKLACQRSGELFVATSGWISSQSPGGVRSRNRLRGRARCTTGTLGNGSPFQPEKPRLCQLSGCQLQRDPPQWRCCNRTVVLRAPIKVVRCTELWCSKLGRLRWPELISACHAPWHFAWCAQQWH